MSDISFKFFGPVLLEDPGALLKNYIWAPTAVGVRHIWKLTANSNSWLHYQSIDIHIS